MPLDWLNTPLDVPVSELIARKKRAKTIEALRSQLQGRLAPSVNVRLQLADLLVQAGRGEEAVPVLLGLADEFAQDGFVAKAVAILKRVDKVSPGRADVQDRLEGLVQLQRTVGRRQEAGGGFELGIEEIAQDAGVPGDGMPALAEPAPALEEAASPFVKTGPMPQPESATAFEDDTFSGTSEVLDADPMTDADAPAAAASAVPAAVPAEPPAEAIATGPPTSGDPEAVAAEPETESEPKTAPEAETASEPAGEVEPAAEPEPSSSATAAPPAGVGGRIRGAFRRFLASLPGGRDEPGTAGEALPSASAEAPPDAVPPALPDAQAAPDEEPPATAAAAPDEAPPPSAAGSAAEDGTHPMPPEPAPAVAPAPADDAVQAVENEATDDEATHDEALDDEAIEVTSSIEIDEEPALPAEPLDEAGPGAAAAEGLSEDDYREQVLDLVQDLLQRPAARVKRPEPRPLDRDRVVAYAQRLVASPLFGTLSEEELLAVVRGLSLLRAHPGDIVVTEDEPAGGLYVLASGRVKVFVRNPDGRNFQVATLEDGDFFGEISTLSGRRRTATVVAAEPCDLLHLERATVDALARDHPRVCDVLEEHYIRRASSPEAAAVRAVVLQDAAAERKAIEILETHFGESRWDPRMRLRLADVLLKAGKYEDAVPILIDLADDLAREGHTSKAVAILKKIEQVQRRDVEEVSLAPLPRNAAPKPAPGGAGAAARGPAPAAAASGPRARIQTEERLQGWIVDLVRDAVARPSGPAAQPRAAPPALRAYGPGLLASPLFEEVSEDELVELIRSLRLTVFEPGDIVVSEGQPGTSLYILASGTAAVFVRAADGRSQPLTALGEGSFFGEIAALSGEARNATVTAATSCEVLELDRPTLDALTARYPGVRRVMEDFARRRLADPEAAALRREAR